MSGTERKSLYFIPWIIFYTYSVYLLVSLGYYDSFLFLNNKLNFPALNDFFVYITLLGDWAIAAGILIVRKRNNPGLLKELLFIAIVGIFIQLLKTLFFNNYDRPPGVFEENKFIYLEIIKMKNHSFPSGHSAVAAAWTLLVARKSRIVPVIIGLAVLGILIAFSRVYIGVHFLGDIVAGSLITFVLYFLLFGFLSKLKIPGKFNRLYYLGFVIIGIRLFVYFVFRV